MSYEGLNIKDTVEIFEGSKIYVGSIVVSLITVDEFRNIGDLCQVIPKSSESVMYYKEISRYKVSNSDFSTSIYCSSNASEWRLATPKEAEAFYKGIRNINDI